VQRDAAATRETVEAVGHRSAASEATGTPRAFQEDHTHQLDPLRGCPEEAVPAGHLARQVQAWVAAWETRALEAGYRSKAALAFAEANQSWVDRLVAEPPEPQRGKTARPGGFFSRDRFQPRGNLFALMLCVLGDLCGAQSLLDYLPQRAQRSQRACRCYDTAAVAASSSRSAARPGTGARSRSWRTPAAYCAMPRAATITPLSVQ